MNIEQFLSKCKSTFIEFYEGEDDAECCIICTYKLTICEPAYIIDGKYLHQSCGELPAEIQHPLHPQHPLKIQALNWGDDGDFVACDGCRRLSVGLDYECKRCNFHLDFKCVSEYEGQALKEKVETITNFHRHKLELINFSLLPLKYSDLIFCCSCLKPIRDSAYVCSRCTFFIDECCHDTIPKQVQSSFHPRHPLLPCIATTNGNEFRNCRGCGAELREGIELRCQRCNYSFHVSCGKHTTPSIRLVVHKHNLFYIYHSHQDISNCDVCNERCEGAIYRCIQCDENFHVECILPPELTHECHDHPLTLTNSVVPKCNPNEFRCDICEEKGDFKHHVYHCKECYYIAHIECVLSKEDPPLEMVPKNTDDSEQQIDEVKEVEEEGAAVDDLEETDEESEESSDEKQNTVTEQKSYSVEGKLLKLNTKIENVKEKIEGLAFKLQRLEIAKRLHSLSPTS
ncbi:hypothetical protein ACOSQ2_008974 [Xanthoceras sorbifolium]